eukprot:TRINITY_DN34739_c0_g1_i1.p1 TRINITY_DN34739_c0_g1~~TRINITY_DN34739_c0_g1_i1.p1  ORF type:complete len:532 (-),score=68.05 TRINITY_DN34739_c0_g1_i1:76-1671(-)
MPADAVRSRSRTPPRGGGSAESFDAETNLKKVQEEWDKAVPCLQEFVRIPNTTVRTDKEWETNGLLDKAAEHVVDWFRRQEIAGCTVELLKDPGFSPFVYIEVPGTANSPRAATTFLMYGHLDKQPHGEGWDADIAPTSGLIRDGKLYGRGAVDDGYHPFCYGIAIKALQRQGIAHPRMVILSECSEESGSMHLGHYVEKLAPRIGNPSVCFCCDAGGDDYDTLWVTTSLRGTLRANVQISTINQGQHSGVFGGALPDPFRVMRSLLSRIEDPATGRILLPELHTKIPVERQSQMKALADKYGFLPGVAAALVDGAKPQTADAFEMRVNSAWAPSMAVCGIDGLPSVAMASPVIHPSVRLMLVIRIPPLVDAEVAVKAVKAALEDNPPYGAKVEANVTGYNGWNAPDLKPNLKEACEQACRTYWSGNKIAQKSCGGGIPLMNMLSEMFPEASIMCTGALGPGGNMHGPNAFLHLDHCIKLTAGLAMIMGILEPDSSWPDDVPRPSTDLKAKKPKYCFRIPELMVGQCPCCM